MKLDIAVLVGMMLLAAAGSVRGQGADILLNCSTCHTVGAAATSQGRAPAPSVYPELSGQPARYLERQLLAFRTGLRQHPQMHQTAVALGQGAGAMARLYADAPMPRLARPSGDHSEAVALVEEGDWSRGLAPCASCHGIEAEDRGRSAPRLHGQPAAYLSAQLRAYADGTRASDPMGRMRAFSARLTPAEIAAVADYYAAWSDTGTPEDQSDD
jgi:cytochrome c553